MVGEEIKISIGMGGFLVHIDNGKKVIWLLLDVFIDCGD